MVRSDGVVIARGQVDVPADRVAFAPETIAGFGVDLQTEQTIDDMDSLALQSPGPFNIALLIEASFQLHQHRDLLAFLDCLEQRFHDRANSGRLDTASF